jgi:hypothetical protein
MSFGLWVGVSSLTAALAAVLAALWPRGLRLLAAALVAGAAVWAVVDAETPFGIGDGVVPDVRGSEGCEAYVVLSERGLRWTHRDGMVRGRAPADRCVDAQADDGFDTDNPIVGQHPAPGTDLGEGGVVRLRYGCEPPCAYGG